MFPDSLSKMLMVFFFGIIFAITAIIQIGIRDDTDPELIYAGGEDTEESAVFVPLKVKIDRAKKAKRKAEE